MPLQRGYVSHQLTTIHTEAIYLFIYFVLSMRKCAINAMWLLDLFFPFFGSQWHTHCFSGLDSVACLPTFLIRKRKQNAKKDLGHRHEYWASLIYLTVTKTFSPSQMTAFGFFFPIQCDSIITGSTHYLQNVPDVTQHVSHHSKGRGGARGGARGC